MKNIKTKSFLFFSTLTWGLAWLVFLCLLGLLGAISWKESHANFPSKKCLSTWYTFCFQIASLRLRGSFGLAAEAGVWAQTFHDSCWPWLFSILGWLLCVAVTCDLPVCRSSQHSCVLTSLERRVQGPWVDGGQRGTRLIRSVLTFYKLVPHQILNTISLFLQPTRTVQWRLS